MKMRRKADAAEKSGVVVMRTKAGEKRGESGRRECCMSQAYTSSLIFHTPASLFYSYSTREDGSQQGQTLSYEDT